MTEVSQSESRVLKRINRSGSITCGYERHGVHDNFACWCWGNTGINCWEAPIIHNLIKKGLIIAHSTVDVPQKIYTLTLAGKEALK